MEQSNDNKNETLEGVDTEQGLELPREDLTEALKKQADSLQEAVDAAAENRARSPFEVAAQQHMMMHNKFVAELDRLSGGAARRILKYLVGYPFFVDELNPQDKNVEAMGYLADKLVQCKFTMIMCKAIEDEARAQEQLAELQAQIEPVPADLPKSKELLEQETTNNEENKE
jgi:hypothetical protein